MESNAWRSSFWKGEKRKEHVEHRLNEAREDPERHENSWDAVNSGLDHGWKSFLEDFRNVLPQGEKSLKDYIEKGLAHKRGHAVGIEFGGPGSAAFAEFSEHFFEKTAGVTLVDNRHRWESDPTARDTARGHKVIPGDLLSEEANAALTAWLDGKKVDLIFERMFGGLNVLPQEPYMLSQKLDQWYRLLDEGGIMFIEVPSRMAYLVQPWAEAVSKFSSIEIQPSNAGKVFRLRKLSGAPEALPLLGALSVRRIEK